MTTTIDTIDYSDNLAAAVILSQFAQRQRAVAEEFAAYPAISEAAISQAAACERVAAALDRMRERSWTVIDLDLYETGERPEPAECRECAGSGRYRRATWAEPAEWCESCEGTGITDCNCPGRCAIHQAHALPEPGEPAPWVNPWAGHTEPPF